MGVGLVCVGLTTLDIAGRPIDRIPEKGGTTLIEGAALSPAGTAGGAALVAATLGIPTSVVSAVGDDAAGRLVRSEFERSGVDTSLLATHADRRTSTTILTIRSDGERPNFHALGAAMFTEITPPIVEAGRKAKFVHWGGVGGMKLDGGPGAEFLCAAKKAGAIVTCDLIGPSGRMQAELERVLPHVDYFMPNVDEALFVTNTNDPAKAAACFQRMGAKTCIFKQGGRGAVRFKGGTRTDFSAHEITPLDTTSCGDSFCAGFIAALDRGFPEDDACRFAMTTAALVAQDLGTLGKLIDFESTLRAMTDLPLRQHAA
ncbi:MAG TPA: carbohydrate kinase family protein [Rhizomicrobium sp.]|nr:carbohydrate kinase family protein [Rhizomicrobium sp.]